MKNWKVKRMSGYSGGPDGRLNVTLRVVADGGSMDEAEALVNAAPDLAAALRAMMDRYGYKNPSLDNEEAAMARAALKKAGMPAPTPYAAGS